MNTEITENNRGWVLYDGACALCARSVARLYPLLGPRGFHFAPLQAPWVRERFGLSVDGLLAEMRLVKPDGRVLGGADAIADIARAIWWAWPVLAFYHLPGGRALMRAGYRWLARRRHCLGGACQSRPAPAPEHTVTTGFFKLP